MNQIHFVNGIKLRTPLNLNLKCSHKMKNGYMNLPTFFFYYFKTILTFIIMFYVTFNKENMRDS